MAKRSDETLLLLPELAAVKKRAVQVKIKALLTEAHLLKQSADRLKQVKDELKDLMVDNAELLSVGTTIGARDGDNCAIVRYQKGKSFLNKEKLIDAGVTPEQLEAGTTIGNSCWVVELPRIGTSNSDD